MSSQNLAFVQLKIAEINTALFFCDNNIILPSPVYIVRSIKTSDDRFVYFFISKGWSNTVLYKGLFFAKLQFYKKGLPFTLKIEGNAKFIHNSTDADTKIDFPLPEKVHSRISLVGVKIEKVDYRELANDRTFDLIQTTVSVVKGILRGVQGNKCDQDWWQTSNRITM